MVCCVLLLVRLVWLAAVKPVLVRPRQPKDIELTRTYPLSVLWCVCVCARVTATHRHIIRLPNVLSDQFIQDYYTTAADGKISFYYYFLYIVLFSLCGPITVLFRALYIDLTHVTIGTLFVDRSV